MTEREDITPLTIARRDYILRHLARNLPGGTWVRISNNELLDFGGEKFFQGCRVTYQNDKSWFRKKSTSGFERDEDVLVNFPWKISHATGWSAPYPTPRIKNTDEGKTTVEHHIDRQKLIDTVKANQEAYDLVLKRAQALYRDEIEKKTEQHVQGQIAVNEINVRDKDGQITIPNDMSETFDKQLRALELDSRDVIILDDGEYQVYVEAQATNIANLGVTAKRLEELP